MNGLLDREDIRTLLAEAESTIAAVHRRPVSLRRSDLTSAEGALRGARSSAQLTPQISEQHHISAYSVLAPDHIARSSTTFVRAPLQLLARIDVLSGGTGRPEQGSAALQSLAGFISARPHSGLGTAVVHGEILAHAPFGSRSALVARVASRVLAYGLGFDPRGLCVPEPYLRRHHEDYQRCADHWADSADAAADFVALHLRAWIAGAAEAESIAAAV
ncbi:hypothetical protein ACQX2H_09380 [Corynebacterium diphtheriae]